MATMQMKKGKIHREVPYGFSATTLFFGCLPALFRGDLKWAVIMFLIICITVGIGWLIFPFIYNQLYIKELLLQGFEPADQKAIMILKNMNLYVDE